MSSITEKSGRGLTGLARHAAVTVLIGLAALAIPPAVLATVSPEGPVLAVVPLTLRQADLPEGVTILSWNGRLARLAGVDSKAARALYAAGALVVLPDRRSGCISLRSPQVSS